MTIGRRIRIFIAECLDTVSEKCCQLGDWIAPIDDYGTHEGRELTEQEKKWHEMRNQITMDWFEQQMRAPLSDFSDK